MNKILSLGKQIQFDGTLHRQARKDKNIAHIFFLNLTFYTGKVGPVRTKSVLPLILLFIHPGLRRNIVL